MSLGTLIITNNTSHAFRYRALLQKALNLTLSHAQISGASEVSLEIVSTTEMKALCLAHHHVKLLTDVLAFRADWVDLAPLIGYNMLGDIVICYDVVVAQAKSYQHSLRREWLYLFTHGLWHLLGFDHQDVASEAAMHERVEAVLSALGVSR